MVPQRNIVLSRSRSWCLTKQKHFIGYPRLIISSQNFFKVFVTISAHNSLSARSFLRSFSSHNEVQPQLVSVRSRAIMIIHITRGRSCTFYGQKIAKFLIRKGLKKGSFCRNQRLPWLQRSVLEIPSLFSLFTDRLFSLKSPPSARDKNKNRGELRWLDPVFL